MADEIRINRPSQVQSSPKPEMQSSESTMQRKNSSAPWIILGVIVIVIIVLGVLFRDKIFTKGGQTSNGSYQAVFLSNGQVYFGKLSEAHGDYIDLKDIYYLQVGPQQGSGEAANTATNTQQQIQLVKLGNELHGPVDEMHINRTQVLFYEDLKSDGQVVKAIQSYKANPNQ